MIKRLNNNKGMAMIVILPILLLITLLGIAAVMNSNTGMDISGSVKRSSQTFYVAEAGLERAVNEYIWGNFFDENVSPITNPFGWLDNLSDSAFYQDVPLGSEATYSVHVEEVDNPGPQSPYVDCRDVTIVSEAQSLGGNEKATVVATMRFGILPAEVFDYSYFINHFGWWSGFSSGRAVANGNVRANGHFDLLSGYFTGNGNPRWDPVTNQIIDGGGVYAGGYTFPTSGSGYQGMASYAANRYSYAGVDKAENDRAIVEMPNLNDPADLDGDGVVKELNPYYIGLANGAYGNPAGKVGVDTNGDGVLQSSEVIVNGAWGDNTGENGNLALKGTSTNPIIIEGTVAVTNNLAITGVVSGQGAFYVGRNTYVGSSVTYKNQLSTRPTYNYRSETPEQYRTRVEQWKTDNANADMVAFMTVNNIVCGNHTTSSWQNNITSSGGWLNDYRNNGKEDVGVDRVFGDLTSSSNPYSASLKEADNKFTVVIADESGHQQQVDLTIVGGVAQVPSGYHIVPGSGEDIDGDGRYGTTYSYNNDIKFDTDFTNFYNVDAGASSYSDYSSSSVARMDGIFYTNHALAGWFTGGCQFNGSIVARNESMILTSGSITMNHDERLSSRYQDLMAMNMYIPLTKDYSTISWEDVSVR
jgi:hypothetical protein